MFGIYGWRTNSCCCGISLRTGTIAIIVLSLVSGACVTTKHDKISCNVISAISLWIGELIFIAIELAALYGVYSNKPDFLIPHLVASVIFLIALLFVIIGLIILFPFAARLLVMANATYETSDGKIENVSEVAKDSFYVFYALMIVFAMIKEAIEFYFFIVVLSYYEYMRANLSNINPAPMNNFVA